MDIDGPLKIGVVEPSAQGNYELHINFTDDFKAADLAAQGERFRSYLGELHAALQQGGVDGRDAQGVMLVQQICEQLRPHIEAGEIALGETLVIEVQRTPGVNLADLLN
ncbi:MAG: transcriptional regulator [Chromatiaceae bacterium]|nr:transcriptional regulator [Gammaproteobacteria bacterium]MCP5301304.1 transcriptional regulator [Chromatiaceae bacterium]MCP5421930.1 transcriptional regulator [Chromatiaceae bacterium]